VSAHNIIWPRVMYKVHDGDIYVGWSWFDTFLNYKTPLTTRLAHN
jgi:hypothetical protein